MKNKKGSIAIIGIVVAIVAITSGVVGYMYAKKSLSLLPKEELIDKAARKTESPRSVAELIPENSDIILSKGSSENQIIADGMTINLPDKWVVAKEDGGRVYIKDLGYQSKKEAFLVVEAKMYYGEAGYSYAVHCLMGGQQADSIINEGYIIKGMLFSCGQGAPAVVFRNSNEKLYKFNWEVSGNEPVSEGMDGPRQPENSFFSGDTNKMYEAMKNMIIPYVDKKY